MKALPSFQLELMNSTDFVLSSPLGRLALAGNAIPDLANLVRDIIEDIDRLAKNCHLPEFTDHSLPHVCSLVKRLSDWGEPEWLPRLDAKEAAVLLLAALTHDLGMLSQDPTELEDPADQTPKGLAELSDWVRRTHVARLPILLRRLLERRGRANLVGSPEVELWVALAEAHQAWPWEGPHGFEKVARAGVTCSIDPQRAKGLAALIAVADLLDEDSTRCDTATLIKHRLGTTLNRAHWLRHGLTRDRVDIRKGKVVVRFSNVPNPPVGMDQVFRALRNHFRLILWYNSDLASIGAKIVLLDFDPCTGEPDEANPNLGDWNIIPEFQTCLPEQLLLTFMREARTEVSDPTMFARLTAIGVELVDLTSFQAFRGPKEPLTDEERVFRSTMNADRTGEGTSS